jgi:hypothetical protein
MSVQSTAQIDTFAAHCAPAWWRSPPRRTTCTSVHSHLTSALFNTAGFTQRWTRREDGNVRLVVCNVGGNKRYEKAFTASTTLEYARPGAGSEYATATNMVIYNQGRQGAREPVLYDQLPADTTAEH